MLGRGVRDAILGKGSGKPLAEARRVYLVRRLRGVPPEEEVLEGVAVPYVFDEPFASPHASYQPGSNTR